jgi:transaldolase
VDPTEIRRYRELGATGATSNPIIIADLIQTGRFDKELEHHYNQGLDDEAIAWAMTDQLVRQAQDVFLPIYEATHGNDGYVSFELDPLLEDASCPLSVEEKARRYVELGLRWSAGHCNRMLKVPATPGGLAALESLAAAGIPLNVTLVFSQRQYEAARDAIWRGAQRLPSKDRFKSVYSIFVSRLDVYTEKHVPELSPKAQGLVGIVNAKQLWRLNQQFWADKKLPLQQEIVFASTGTKKPDDPPWKYVAAFAGSDIETNPPATNAAVEQSGLIFQRQVDQMPPDEVIQEIVAKVDMVQLEETLMREGLAKFAEPHRALIRQIASKRRH